MTTDQKNTLVSMIVSLGTYATYVIIVLSRAAGGDVTQVAYVAPLLWTVGITVVASIVGSIVVAIVTAAVERREPDSTDERDRLINRRGDQVSFVLLSLGMFGVLVLAMIESPHFWIANAAYASGFVASLAGSIVKLIVYRRGF